MVTEGSYWCYAKIDILGWNERFSKADVTSVAGGSIIVTLMLTLGIRTGTIKVNKVIGKVFSSQRNYGN